MFVNQADLTVEDNTVTGGNFAGIALGGDGLHDAQVLNNTITGKSGEFTNGIRLINFGALQNRHVTIARNTVTGMRSSDPARGNGISLGAEGAAGTVHVERNRLVDNSGAGLRNEDPDADIVASHNWWGCNTGPGFSGCDAVTSPDGGSNPSFTPWLLLSFTANPTAIAPGGTSSLLADVANRSSGGAATGPFFTSGVATFGFTALTAFRALNAFSPTTVPLDANLKARSVFTAGAQPPKELSTTVDHQTVQMAISNPPKPDVVPDVIPDHKRLAPGQRTAVVVTLANRGNRTARAIRACLRLSAKLNFSGRVCRTIARLLPGHSVAFVVHVRARRAGCAAERRLVYRLIVRVRGQRTLIQRTRGRLLGGPCFTG